MKKITFIMITLLAMFGYSQKMYAQIITDNDFADNGYTVSAGQVVWLGSSLDKAVEASQSGYVYLYNVKTGQFLNAGGAYGVQAVLSSVGMRVKVAQTTYNSRTVYTIQGRINNEAQGDYMSPNQTDGYDSGFDIYMDRLGTHKDGKQYSRPNWQFTVTQTTRTVNNKSETFNTFTIKNASHKTSYTVGTSNNNGVYFVDNNNNNLWRFITEDDYVKAMDNVTWGEVDLGAFVQDAEFGRDNKDGRYWVWSNAEAPAVIEEATGYEGPGETNPYTYTTDNWDLNSSPKHWHQRNQDKMGNGVLTDATNGLPRTTIGRNVAGTGGNISQDDFRNAFAKYYAAEIYNEKITLYQDLEMSNVENLHEGLYKMTVQALYYDDVNGETNNEVSYVFVETTLNGVTSYQELPILPMNKNGQSGITPHSGVSAGKVFDDPTTANTYLMKFFVELKKDSKLRIGVKTKKAEGWTVLGNIHFYAHGKVALFIDEDWNVQTRLPYMVKNQETGDYSIQYWSEVPPYEFSDLMQGYEYPATIYYNRTFTQGKFNTICLPISLTGNQVRQAFGNDCMLSKFDRLSANKSIIVFEPVDLDTEGLDAGYPYIVKPTKNPDIAKGAFEYIEVGNGGKNHVARADGPVYYISGVTKGSYEETGIPDFIPVEHDGITFQGTLYRMGIKKEDVTGGNKNYWMITKGKMYHLDGSKPGNTYTYDYDNHVDVATPNSGYTVWGTYCYLYGDKTQTASNAKNLTFGIEDEFGDITAIDIEGMEVAHSQAIEDNSVYTLNGQKIGGQGNLNSLSKGIYIVNGKKYVVK